jgi:hypothetical protein
MQFFRPNLQKYTCTFHRDFPALGMCVAVGHMCGAVPGDRMCSRPTPCWWKHAHGPARVVWPGRGGHGLCRELHSAKPALVIPHRQLGFAKCQIADTWQSLCRGPDTGRRSIENKEKIPYIVKCSQIYESGKIQYIVQTFFCLPTCSLTRTKIWILCWDSLVQFCSQLQVVDDFLAAVGHTMYLWPVYDIESNTNIPPFLQLGRLATRRDAFCLFGLLQYLMTTYRFEYTRYFYMFDKYVLL